MKTTDMKRVREKQREKNINRSFARHEMMFMQVRRNFAETAEMFQAVDAVLERHYKSISQLQYLLGRRR